MSVTQINAYGSPAGLSPRPVQAAPNPPAAQPAPVKEYPAGSVTGATAEALNEAFQLQLPPNSRLAIERDEATSRYVFKSVDQATGEVIQQYPTESMLAQISSVRRIIGLAVNAGA